MSYYFEKTEFGDYDIVIDEEKKRFKLQSDPGVLPLQNAIEYSLLNQGADLNAKPNVFDNGNFAQAFLPASAPSGSQLYKLWSSYDDTEEFYSIVKVECLSALSWLINAKLAQAINIDVKRGGSNVVANINIFIDKNKTDKYNITLWSIK